MPDSTLENVSKAVLEFGNTGQSIMEVSHRSADFQAVYEEAVALVASIALRPGFSDLEARTSISCCNLPLVTR